MPRRRVGELLPIEEAILVAGLDGMGRGEPEFHGFAVAAAIQDAASARRLTAHGTLYKALGRMETSGLLTSRWEDPEIAAADGRPRRRLYRVTGAGELALSAAANAHPARRPALRRPGVAAT